jgi:hypothetical protein
MINKIKPILSDAVILLLAIILVACVPGKRLMPGAAKLSEMKGTFTLFLYGCNYPSDVKNVAFFVSEDSKYPLDIFDIATSYKIKKGLTAQQAMDEANSFVRCSSFRVWQTQLQLIPDDSGGIVGYELRPLYMPYELGAVDAMDINYFLKNGKVVTYIRLDPDVKKNLESLGDGSGQSDGK